MNKRIWLLSAALCVGMQPFMAQAVTIKEGGKTTAQTTDKKSSGKAAFSAEEKRILTKVETYLNGLTTIVSDFSQVAPDGSLVSGKFYLSRPAKMRWQYDPPTPILMVTSGKYLIYYDYELEQVSDIPLDDTLAGFLARAQISFDDSVIVEGLQNNAGSLRITLTQKKRPKDGKLTLEFTDSPMTLRNMVVTDATGQVTTVSLNNARYGVPIDAELFKFSDPRYGKRKKRN